MSKYTLNDITNSFLKDNYSNEINIQKIDNCRNFMNVVRDKFEEFIDDKNYFDNTINNCIKLDYNDRDKYYLSLTTRRSNMIKSKLLKKKYINLVNNQKINLKFNKNKNIVSNLSNESFLNPLFKDMKGKSSMTKIFIEEFNENSNNLILLENELKKLMKDKYIFTLKIFIINIPLYLITLLI